MKPKFSRHSFEKKAEKSNFMKIRPVGAELFHADEQTDTTKLIASFRNFAKAPRNGIYVIPVDAHNRKNRPRNSARLQTQLQFSTVTKLQSLITFRKKKSTFIALMVLVHAAYKETGSFHRTDLKGEG